VFCVTAGHGVFCGPAVDHSLPDIVSLLLAGGAE